MYYTKDCKNCTKKFQSKRSDSEYCSSSCRSLYRRKSIDGHEDFVSDLKKQLLEIEKKLDFVIQKMNETTVGKHPESDPLKTTFNQKQNLTNSPRKKTVMDYAQEIGKLQFDEEYRNLAKEIRADANLNEKQKTALIASMNCPNL